MFLVCIIVRANKYNSPSVTSSTKFWYDKNQMHFRGPESMDLFLRSKDLNSSLYDLQKLRLNTQLHQRSGWNCVEMVEFQMMATAEVDYLAELVTQLSVVPAEVHDQDYISGSELVVYITTLLVSISIGQFHSTNNTRSPTCAEVWRKTSSARCLRFVVAGSSVRFTSVGFIFC
jgi:hypothetical protein